MRHLIVSLVIIVGCGIDEDLSTDEHSAEVTWAGPVPLSPVQLEGRTRYNFGKAIAIDGGGVIHVTWVDTTSTNANAPEVQGDIYYQRSATGGTSWTAPRKLSAATGLVSFPKIAASGPHVYVVWHETVNGRATSYIAHSSDQGSVFSSPSRVTTAHATLPAVAASGSGVHVVWAGFDQVHNAVEIYVTSSDNFGAAWKADHMVSSADGHTSWTPDIAANGIELYAVWTDERFNRNPDGSPYDCGQRPSNVPPPTWAGDDGCREEVYFAKSTNFGSTWVEQRLTTSPQGIGHNAASLAVSAGAVHVTYFRKPEAQTATLYRRSLNAGSSFLPATTIDSSRVTMRPVVAARGDVVSIVYTGIVPSSGAKTFHAQSTDRGQLFSQGTPVVDGNGESMQPSLVLDPANSGHVIYTDLASPGATKHRVFYARTIPQ